MNLRAIAIVIFAPWIRSAVHATTQHMALLHRRTEVVAAEIASVGDVNLLGEAQTGKSAVKVKRSATSTSGVSKEATPVQETRTALPNSSYNLVAGDFHTPTPTGVLADGTYTIENVKAKCQYLVVLDGSTSNGAAVQIHSLGGPETQWRIVAKSGGAYTIENVKATGKYLNLDGGSTSNGATVHMWDNPGSPETQWRIVATSDGAYTIESVKATGKYLNHDSRSNGVHMWDNPGSPETQWNVRLEANRRDARRNRRGKGRPIPNFASNLREWRDSNGCRIEAHGGALLFDQGVWYWFGETNKEHWWNQGVNLYSFHGDQPAAFTLGLDDGNSRWKSLGTVLNHDRIKKFFCEHAFDNDLKDHAERCLKNCSVPDLCHASATYAVERPKVLYCKATKKFVMWLHVDNVGCDKSQGGEDYCIRAAMVAKADRPGGPWLIHNAFRTGGFGSLDLNIWMDRQTDEAYVVRSVDNERTAIALLTYDYLGTEKEIIDDMQGENCYGCFNCKTRYKNPCHVEGCAMWRPDASTVYMLCSELTGWDPNPAHMFQAYYKGDESYNENDYNVPTLNHPNIAFKQLGDPFMLSDKSWYTQPSGMVEIPANLPRGHFPDIFMYMGDNWINGIMPNGVPCGGYPDTDILAKGPRPCKKHAGYKWLPWYKHLPWPLALQNNTEWTLMPRRTFKGLSSKLAFNLQYAAVNYGWKAINTYEQQDQAPINERKAREYMAHAVHYSVAILSEEIMRKIEELMQLWGWFCAQTLKRYDERVGTWYKLQTSYDQLYRLFEQRPYQGSQNADFWTSGLSRMFEYAAWYTSTARLWGNNNEALKNKHMSEKIRDALVSR